VRLRGWVIGLGGLTAFGGVLALGRLFPEYAIDRFAEQAASYQEVGEHFAGGSTIELGDPSERSLLGQVAFAPLGLVNVLFRPFLFEVRNAQMLLNALETAVLTVLVGWALYRQRLRDLYDRIVSSPELVFCAAFTLTMGLAVGLTTTNLGTLSRYRVPMMPYFVFLTLVTASVRPRPASQGVGESGLIPIIRGGGA
jgi:hypothetical protein